MPSAPSPALQSPGELVRSVERLIGSALEDAERIYEVELASQNIFVDDIIAHTRKFRGKRLRPILLLLFGQATGKVSHDHSVLAAVVEMIHTATLVHDDVLDNADVRRHVATINTRWNNETSVLFGDYLFTHAFHLAASLDTARACRLIGRATNLVCEGELSQVRHRGNLGITEEEYLQVIDGKTGALCAVACQLGAMYADGAPSQIAAAERFGLLVGRAFQIADDLLDLTGDQKLVGKTLGSDLSQGKLTLPVIRMLAASAGDDRDKLMAALQEPDQAAVRLIQRMCQERGFLHEAQREAIRFSEAAVQLLAAFPDSPARQFLRQMAVMAVERTC